MEHEQAANAVGASSSISRMCKDGGGLRLGIA